MPQYRTHEDNAARQAAYRRRRNQDQAASVADAEVILTIAHELNNAVRAAAAAGNPLATAIARPDPLDTIIALTDHLRRTP